MWTRHKWLLILMVALLAFLAWGAGIVQAAPFASPPNTAGAGSPMSTYTAGAITYVLLAAFLVLTLLGGGFLVLNLGLMSKRDEDRIGGRTPSDVGILKHNVWPEEPYTKHYLPAEEDVLDIPVRKRSVA